MRIESAFSYDLNLHVDPYVAVRGETQMTEGRSFPEATPMDPEPASRPISDFMDPAFFTQSLGLGYEAGPTFKTRLGVALKQTVADRFALRYSDDPATPRRVERLRSEVGAESVTEAKATVSENVLLTSRLGLFSNLASLRSVDVRGDALFAAKVSKHISVSFHVELLYDRDTSARRQLKQVLAVGLTYTIL